MECGSACERADRPSKVLDVVASMVAYWDCDLRCRFANRAYERWFGVDPAGLVGRSIQDLLGPDLFALNKPYIDGALRGEVQVFERLVPCVGSVLRPSLARYTPDVVNGEVIGFVAEVTETTLLHQAQQALKHEMADRERAYALLKKSEAALKQAQELGQIGSWEWEVEPDITAWSEQLYAIFGRDPTRLPPSYAEQVHLYTRRSWQRLEVAVQKALATGQPWVLELEYIRADGRTGWIEGRGQCERDDAGAVNFMHGTAQEISHRKRSAQATADERRLTRALRALAVERGRYRDLDAALARAKKTEVLGLLSAGIAHDFNNVLAAVAGSLHLLKSSSLDARSRDFTERGLRGVDRATRLVRQLMDFARSGPGESTCIDLADFAAQCSDLLALSLGPTIQLRTEVPPGCVVEVDPSQLEVALINLLVNARDAMPHGGVVTLGMGEVRELPAEGAPATVGWLGLRVADSGTGMTADVLRRVKEPFFTTKTAGAGTGLGLAMVDAFARSAGGWLQIDSQPGAGTTVTICLPRASAAVGLALELAPLEPVPRAPEEGVVLLVVDDDALVLPVVAGYLRGLDYLVVEASSAGVALDIVRSAQPLRLVITDIAMRDLDGLQLADRLRAIRPALPILFMTGNAGHAGIGAEDVLVKPFSQAELARRVIGKVVAKQAPATRLAGRIKHPAVMALYEAWLGARAAGALPTIGALDIQGSAAPECIFVAEAVSLQPFTLRRILVGAALASHLVDDIDGALIAADDDDALGRLEAAYRRCLRLREPSHEYLRMRLGQGDSFELERLLLPCEEPGGTRHHLVGMVIITNHPASQLDDTP